MLSNYHKIKIKNCFNNSLQSHAYIHIFNTFLNGQPTLYIYYNILCNKHKICNINNFIYFVLYISSYLKILKSYMSRIKIIKISIIRIRYYHVELNGMLHVELNVVCMINYLNVVFISMDC